MVNNTTARQQLFFSNILSTQHLAARIQIVHYKKCVHFLVYRIAWRHSISLILHLCASPAILGWMILKLEKPWYGKLLFGMFFLRVLIQDGCMFVDAPNAVVHMMSGKAVSQAVRAHLIVDAD